MVSLVSCPDCGVPASQSGLCDRTGRLFERFTAHARAAINAGVEDARGADDRWVEPAHHSAA